MRGLWIPGRADKVFVSIGDNEFPNIWDKNSNFKYPQEHLVCRIYFLLSFLWWRMWVAHISMIWAENTFIQCVIWRWFQYHVTTLTCQFFPLSLNFFSWILWGRKKKYFVSTQLTFLSTLCMKGVVNEVFVESLFPDFRFLRLLWSSHFLLRAYLACFKQLKCCRDWEKKENWMKIDVANKLLWEFIQVQSTCAVES